MRWVCAVACALPLFLHAQAVKSQFLAPADSFNPERFVAVSGGIGLGTAGSLVLLNQYWYANYPRGPFHFFDDSGEWMQIDKLSHAFNAYYMSMWARELYLWTGMPAPTSDYVGAATGAALLMTVELLDGFSTKWGASVFDFSANLFGSGLFLVQQRLVHDQPLALKVSSFPKSYEAYPTDVTERARELFGRSLLERIIKDYNATTIWVSVSMSSITGLAGWPRWLNLAVGYGAQNLFGGFENRWCDDPLVPVESCEPSMVIDHTGIPRYRQWYLSPDINFTKLQVRSATLRLLLNVVNIIKVPAPTVEFNRIDGLKFHFLHF
jgi:hypothetical protein